MKRIVLFCIWFSGFSFAQSQNLDSLARKKDSAEVSLMKREKLTSIDDIVLTGTTRLMSKSKSPVAIDVYHQKFFQKNPTPNVFEAIAMVNGIKPQLNCSVCNTGDIHINGLEGAYTMVLIDGMPIVSSLSTVYGLSGIPNSLVDRIEVIKGPASALYGSDAMGGVINIITKNVLLAPKFHLDVMTTSWNENNFDVASKFNLNKNIASLFSLNYFNFNNKIDHNKDNFTDAALQNRISVFNKWNFKRKENRIGSFALRYLYEDRYGGEMQWEKKHRGGNEVYGESVYTNRVEAFGMYQWPMKETVISQFSYNNHQQDSYYGEQSFVAQQKVTFLQTYWNNVLGKHEITSGFTFKNTIYDDNTPATMANDGIQNQASHSPIFGFFVQDQINFKDKNVLLLGYRVDYDKVHHAVHSPRFAWKFSPNTLHTLRLNFGTGFRVVNLFTEDHAALTGSREVIITDNLKPERSYNANLNYIWKIPLENQLLTLDASAFYTYFTNKIVGNFDENPLYIIYDNLKGFGVSKGISSNVDLKLSNELSFNFGLTYNEVYQKSLPEIEKTIQLHAPKWSGTYSITYQFKNQLTVDFTGQFYGKMRLPILENDFRPEFSPTFLLANIQVSKKWKSGIEMYGGLKNILNFTPKNPIMRPQDPFDTQVDDVLNNPNRYTFDTTYGYASMQGIRGFLGIRFALK